MFKLMVSEGPRSIRWYDAETVVFLRFKLSRNLKKVKEILVMYHDYNPRWTWAVTTFTKKEFFYATSPDNSINSLKLFKKEVVSKLQRSIMGSELPSEYVRLLSSELNKFVKVQEKIGWKTGGGIPNSVQDLERDGWKERVGEIPHHSDFIPIDYDV